MTPKLILASESPRRRELLQSAGYYFDVLSVKVSEIPDENLNASDQILDIARRKSRAAWDLLTSRGEADFILICADTEVIFNARPLGKPASPEDAHRILRLLSGKSHEVKTAVCLLASSTGKEFSQVETTHVHFKNLSDEEIWTYIRTGEPLDKAGAYGIQGLGLNLVERFEGPFDNVVGLPLAVVEKLLSKARAEFNPFSPP